MGRARSRGDSDSDWEGEWGEEGGRREEAPLYIVEDTNTALQSFFLPHNILYNLSSPLLSHILTTKITRNIMDNMDKTENL